MITVKELVPMIIGTKNIELDYGGSFHRIDPRNDFLMDAYGRYVINCISVGESGDVTLMLAMQPVVKEDGD